MNCSSVDLKAYVLGELPESERGLVAGHARECASCGEELERLNLTHLAMASLRDEEAPRRIAFVSDKVFEPRWWQRIWQSGPAMGFASAAVLACAILAHGVLTQGMPRPAGTPVAAVDSAAVQRRVSAEVNERLNAAVSQAVSKAVSDAEAREKRDTATLLAAAEQRYEFQRKADLAAVAANLEMYRKQFARTYMANAGLEMRAQ
jgi:anti-sigma factor RsiW